MNIDDFARRLRECMKAKGYTGYRLAQELGIDRARLFCWLHAKNYPQLYYLGMLCNVLDVSADYLLFGKERDE